MKTAHAIKWQDWHRKKSVSIMSRVIKMIGKNMRRSRKLQPSAAMVQKRLERSTRLLNGVKNHGNRNLIFYDEKTFNLDPDFSKQNDKVVAFGNDASEYCRVSTTKSSASITTWFERGYRLTFVAYKQLWNKKKYSMGQEYHLQIWLRLPKEQSGGTHGKDCGGLVGRQHELLSQRFCPPQSSDMNRLDFSL